MFEKEAEEWWNNEYFPSLYDNVSEVWQEGAEFGYNEANDKIEALEERCEIANDEIIRLQKINEWHYMKDVNCYEDLHFPPIEDCKDRICIWKVKDCSENYHCGSYEDLWYEINAYYVIAWKEIVLPKESE